MGICIFLLSGKEPSYLYLSCNWTPSWHLEVTQRGCCLAYKVPGEAHVRSPEEQKVFLKNYSRQLQHASMSDTIAAANKNHNFLTLIDRFVVIVIIINGGIHNNHNSNNIVWFATFPKRVVGSTMWEFSNVQTPLQNGGMHTEGSFGVFWICHTYAFATWRTV